MAAMGGAALVIHITPLYVWHILFLGLIAALAAAIFWG